MKAYGIQRFLSWAVDILIVSLLISIVTYFLPISQKYETLVKENETIANSYLEQKITTEEYVKLSYENNYETNKEIMAFNIANVVVYILYFTVFQYYNNGQTIGKKLFKITVEKRKRGSLDMNAMVIRSFLINGMLSSILLLVALTIATKSNYIYFALPIEIISSLIFIISVIMVLIRKDGLGLHDLLAGTKVVLCEEDEEVKEAVVVEEVTEELEEGNEKNERIHRTRTSKKRKSSRNK